MKKQKPLQKQRKKVYKRGAIKNKYGVLSSWKSDVVKLNFRIAKYRGVLRQGYCSFATVNWYVIELSFTVYLHNGGKVWVTDSQKRLI